MTASDLQEVHCVVSAYGKTPSASCSLGSSEAQVFAESMIGGTTGVDDDGFRKGKNGSKYKIIWGDTQNELIFRVTSPQVEKIEAHTGERFKLFSRCSVLQPA